MEEEIVKLRHAMVGLVEAVGAFVAVPSADIVRMAEQGGLPAHEVRKLSLLVESLALSVRSLTLLHKAVQGVN